MSLEDIRAFVAALPQDQQPQDGEQLARILVRAKNLTAYQAQQIYAGRASSLVLGNYVVLDKLGEGGMGMVLRAEHKRMKRKVALKVLSPAALKSDDAVERFHREVEAAAKLNHPNIVTAFDADESGGVHFLVMQYVAGRDLSVLVKDKGPLSPEKAIACVLQAARGLEFAHREGVVHRDIKPANLLLDNEGVVQILDMGLARLDSNDADQADLTGSGQIMGTVDYMAPEQAMSTKSADGRSDVYSLGSTLWYLLCGTAAYQGDSLMAKMLAHREAPIPSLQQVCPAASAELAAVFEKMVAKQPEDRYQTMTEVIAALTPLAPTGSTPSIHFDNSESRELRTFLEADPAGLEPGELSGLATGRMQTATTEQLGATLDIHSPATDTSPKTQDMLAPTLATPLQQKKPATATLWRNRRVTIGLGVVVAMAFLLFIAATVFFFQTPNGGTLRIEITDPEIEVAVKGTTIVVKGAEKKDVVLQPGKHVLHVQRGDFAFDTTSLILKKGETVIVRAELVDGDVQVVHNGQMIGSTNVRPAENSKPNYLLQFDGVDDYVEFSWPKFDATAPFTIEALVQGGRQNPPYGGIVLTANTQNTSIFIDVDTAGVPEGGRMEKGVLHSTFDVTAVDRIAAKPTPVAIVWDGRELALFFDGQLTAKGPKGTYKPGGHYPKQALLGAAIVERDNQRSLQSFFRGSIDELRISSVARYTKSYTPEAHLAVDEHVFALYHFDEGAGLVLRDASGNDRHGAIHGAKWLAAHVPSDDALATASNSNAPPIAVAPFSAASAKVHQQGWAKHLKISLRTINSIGAELILIPPGRFMMGSTEEDIDHYVDRETSFKSSWIQSEGPRHEVELTQTIQMSAHEITQSQWTQVMGSNPSHFNKNGPERYQQLVVGVTTDQLPVEFVNYYDVVEFCNKLSAREGLPAFYQIEGDQVTGLGGTGYRLPWEAEWEFACRAGTDTRYAFGDPARVDEHAWYVKNSAERPHRVGQLKPNPFGFYDMHGNVSEWCGDRGGSYTAALAKNPTGPLEGDLRITRGESWYTDIDYLRTAARVSLKPEKPNVGRGFRIARTADRRRLVETPPRAVAPFDTATAKRRQTAWSEHLNTPVEKSIEIATGVNLEMMLIPPGEFRMGSSAKAIESFSAKAKAEEDRNAAYVSSLADHEGPEHAVVISQPFYLAKLEFTQAQWLAVMGDNPSEFGDRPENPVEMVNFIEVGQLIEKLNTLSSIGEARFSLPTEAQWEYACRAGTESPWVCEESELVKHAWYKPNAPDETKPCGKLLPNPFGLHDMHGNIWEWTADWSSETYYERSPKQDPRGPANGIKRVLKGGGWGWTAQGSRAAIRNAIAPKMRFNGTGFRLLLTIEPPKN